MEKKRPAFQQIYQEEWQKVEELLVVAMLYHSNSIEESKKYLENTQNSPSNTEQIHEKLKLLGTQANDVLAWMQSRLQGEQGMQTMIRDLLEHSQEYITKWVEKKKEEEEEQKKKKDKEDEEKLLKLKEEEEQKKKDQDIEESKSKQKVEKKKGPIVATESKVVQVKRKKLVKMSQEPGKLQKDKKKKQAKKDAQEAKEEEKKQDVDLEKTVQKKQEQQPEEKPEDKETIKYLKISKAEEREIKNKIYNTVYELFLSLYQGNQDRVKPLCMLLEIEFNPEDPNESLKAIFKRIKSKVKSIIDFDGDAPIREKIDIEELKLESPYQEISKEVRARLLFLLEIKTSIDYQNKVIHIQDSSQSRKAFTSSNSSLNQYLSIKAAALEDQNSSHIITEGDDDNDSDILEPLGIQRSQSVQVGFQRLGQSGIGGVSQVLAQNNMKEEEIVNWIDNYRKWRQWSRFHKLMSKGQAAGGDLEEDLTSPFCTPLLSVVAFAKASKLPNPDILQKTLTQQQVNAAFRIFGLQVQEKLLQLTVNTPFQRFVWGNISSSLQENPFFKIETCGEQLTKTINEQTRVLIKQLLLNVIQGRRSIENILNQINKQARQDQPQTSQSQQNSNSAQSQEKPGSKSSQPQKPNSAQSTSTTEEWLMFEYLKRLLHTLNDVRVLLNSVYSREYVLESLRHDDKIKKSFTSLDIKNKENQEQSQIEIETIRNFLKSIVQLMLYCQGGTPMLSKASSYTRLNFAIAHSCKLILNLFMSDSSMIRAAETQRMLQEMLIDIIVAQLEKICGLKSISKDEPKDFDAMSASQQNSNQQSVTSKLSRPYYQEECTHLLKLLSEVIRISHDTNKDHEHQQVIQQQIQQSTDLNGNKLTKSQTLTVGQPLTDQIKKGVEPKYFLSEGSEKVMRCAQILIHLMHNIEVPVLMRQAIKCAKLFFKLVDFNLLKLHEKESEEEKTSIFQDTPNEFLMETLKQIGIKITNSPIAPAKEEPLQEEKQYVVYANINSQDEDFSFILTTLYHWETLYPTFTLDLPKDPSEIMVKAEKPKEKEGEEGKAAADGKVEITEEQLAKDEEMLQEKKLLQQLSEAENNTDLQELISLQRQQLQGNQSYRGRYYIGSGGRGGKPPGGKKEQLPKEIGEYYKKLVNQAPPGGAQPSKYGGYGNYEQPPKGTLGSMFGHPPPSGSAYQYGGGQFLSSMPSIATFNTIGLTKLEQLYDEVVKQTWEDVKSEDPQEEKDRKLQERNYNTRVIAHIKDSIVLAASLYQRYSSPLTEAMPYKKAMEFAGLLQAAYKGLLEPIQVNPFTKKESKEKKLAIGKTVSQLFPLIMKTIEGPKQARELTPGTAPPIVIAPKQLVISLAEKRISQRYELIVESKTQALKNLDKNPIEGFNCNVIHQSLRRQGASISTIIQEFIQLLRSLVIKQKQAKVSNEGGLLSQQTVPHSENFKIKKSMQKMQKQQEQFSSELMKQLNLCIESISKQKWADFTKSDQKIIFGLLAVVGGWTPQIRSGQPVLVEINNQFVEAIAIDDGLGKKRISVILENDETLSIVKVPVAKAKAYYKYEWPFDSDFGANIDQRKLCEATINVYQQVKAQGESQQQYQEGKPCQVENEKFLMLMLLKIGSSIEWTFKDKENETFKKYLSILIQITQDQSSEEDKTRVYWEKALIDSWERLVDKDEQRNYDFFVARESFIKETKIQEESKAVEVPLLISSKSADSKVESRKGSEQIKKSVFSQGGHYTDTDFVQPLSSYLTGLPEPIPKKNQSEAALKLLAYWEKNIIPKIIEFVRTTYKPWEMEMGFEQLRHPLRHGDTNKALEDAMTMCERKMPQGVVIPDETYDWTAKMIDECIVDTWALAKFKSSRHATYSAGIPQPSAGGSTGSSQSSNSASGESNFPLLNKLVNLGIEEIVILIKAVDVKGNVVLAEYQDPDTMQVHSLWIPASNLNDLHTPLPPRAIGFRAETIRNKFEFNVEKMQTIYARQTLIQFFQSFQLQQRPLPVDSIIQLPYEEIKLQELISWSVWEEFSDSPITGWMRELHCAIPYSTIKKSSDDQQINTDSLKLQDIVEMNGQEIVFEQLQNKQKSNKKQKTQTLSNIKNLLEQSIGNIKKDAAGADIQILDNIVDWCATNWYQISERIRNDRAVFDLCKEYENHVSNFSESVSDSEQLRTPLLPLHEIVQQKTSSNNLSQNNHAANSSIGTLVMFKKSGAYLTPTSKVHFYSDINKINLESEINAGSEGKRDLPPLLLNHGKIWVNFDAGTTALLPRHQQTDQKSTLPCAVVQIPSAWTVCCWLTEVLTNALLTNIDNCKQYAIQVYEKLISALVSFYEEAKAPTLIKSIVLTLLSRIIRKLRFIYQHNEPERDKETIGDKEELKKHFDRLFLKQEFINTILSELLVNKESDEQILANQGQQVLYSSFVQNSVELILTIMLPTQKGVRINSYKDLLDLDKIQMPEWIEPLIKVSYFMHFFSNEALLPLDIMKEIFDQTKLSKHQMDNILVIRNIPIDQERDTKWVKDEIIKTINKHGARILNPERDIVFAQQGSIAVVIIDDFDPMVSSEEVEEMVKAEQLLEDEEQDNDDSDDTLKKVVKEEVKEEPLVPSIWECPACTFENPFGSTVCDICQSARPPLEAIMSAFLAKINEANESSKPADANKDGSEQEKSKHIERLELLGSDLARIISREERRVVKEQKRKEREEKKRIEDERIKKEEEEKKKVADEEKKKKEEQDKLKKKVEEEKSKKSGFSSQSKKEKKLSKKDQDKEQAKIIDPKQQSHESPKFQFPHPNKVPNKDQFMNQYLLDQDLEDKKFAEMQLKIQQQMLMHDSYSEQQVAELYEQQFREEIHDDDGGEGDDAEGDEFFGDNDPRKAKLIELGIDPGLIESDPDLALALAESMIADQEKVKHEEEMKLKMQKEEQEKLKQEMKKLEKQASKEEEKKEGGVEVAKRQYTTLDVLVGQNQVFEHIESGRAVYEILRDRLDKKSYEKQETADQQQFAFSPLVCEILTEIYQNFQQLPNSEIEMPTPTSSNESLLEDLDFTKDGIRGCGSPQELIEKCSLLVETDIRLFYQFLEKQGYDFYLQKVAYPSYQCKGGNQSKINLQLLQKLKTFIEIDMCNESKSIVNLYPNTLRLLSKTSPQMLSNTEKSIHYYDDSMMSNKYPEINENLSLIDIRYQWALLRIFNQYLAPAVPFINNSQSISDIPQNTVPLTLSAYMSFSRNLCLMNVKFDLRHLILEKTSAQREHIPKLFFERLKLAHKNRENEEQDNNGSPQRRQAQSSQQSPEKPNERKKDKKNQEFMFLQAYEQIKDMDLALLRPKKPQGAEPHLSFHIVFKGEHVVGEGGPYRQFFADISQELQPVMIGANTGTSNMSQKLLGLLYPSANNRTSSNIGKDKFVLAPSKTTSNDLSLYEFLGILMGACIRTGAHLDLDLPQFVWKQLVGQIISYEDIIEIDIGFWKLMQFMLQANKKLYEESIYETYAVTLSDEYILELKENGKECRVPYEDRVDYIKKALYGRMKESSLQCEAIKRGIIKIVPEALLNMVTSTELETWVCGKKIVDIDLLKRHTKYGGDKKTEVLHEESRRVTFFWEVLREFVEEDKQKFIKFCWGQQRLPANDEEFERRQVRFMIKPAINNKHGDGALPKADTCFFNLELPDYSSKEVMKQRILLAIHTDCDSMNAEANHMNMNSEQQMMEGDNSYDEEY